MPDAHPPTRAELRALLRLGVRAIEAERAYMTARLALITRWREVPNPPWPETSPNVMAAELDRAADDLGITDRKRLGISASNIWQIIRYHRGY